MPKRLNFMVGVVMLVVAGTLAFVVTSGGEGKQANPRAAKRGKSTGERDWPSGMRTRGYREDAVASRGEGSAKPAHSSRPDNVEPSHEPPRMRTDLKVQVSPRHPRQAQLAGQAELVETFALRRLEEMTRELELTPEQQGRIFPILVRGSQSYDPGMRIIDGNNATATPSSKQTATADAFDRDLQQELIQKELKPEQANKLVDRSIGDLLIWEEIIGDLTRQLDQATPGDVAAVEPQRGMTGAEPETPLGNEPPSDTDSTTPPESHGGRNIFDTVPEE